MTILKFKDLDEVVDRATRAMRLAAGRWTRTSPRACHCGQGARGTVWVNCYDVFDAGAPSRLQAVGIGRELGDMDWRITPR